MAKRKIALWFLNRVASDAWDHEKMLRVLGRCGKNAVMLGQRRGGLPPECSPGVLMKEGNGVSEYFVPIPVKCLGDTDALGVPSSSAGHLDNIRAFYRQYYGGDEASFPWWKYWQPKSKSIFGDIGMSTPDHEGYYRTLQKFSEDNPGCRHILIGYSQGGLVARYLAYLDEYLFDNALIDGVIAIASPNFGSPLARPDNDVNVMQTLALVMAGLAQLDSETFPAVADKLRALADKPQSLGLPWLLDLLDKALGPFLAAPAPTSPSLAEKKPRLFEFLETARKWLSGLEGKDGSAIFKREESVFFDLDIGLLPKSGSVLNAVNRYPLRRIKHAAIVGTDNRLDSLARAGIDGFLDTRGWLERFLVRGKLKKLEGPLRDLLEIAGNAYREAMIEQGYAPLVGRGCDPHIEARIKDYEMGVKTADSPYRFRTSVDVPPRAHDFVIPSAYQLIENPSDAFLGNWVNPEGSHLSGADPKTGGKKSHRYVIDILRGM